MTPRIPMISGDEYDALTVGGRRVHIFRAGVRDAIKRRFRRRERHTANLETALAVALEYIEDHVDVVDGSYGQPAPNRAMSVMNEINEILGKGGC